MCQTGGGDQPIEEGRGSGSGVSTCAYGTSQDLTPCVFPKIVLPEIGLTVTEAARQLGISRVQLSRVLNERAGISPDLAMRLEQWLGGPSAESWLHMQADYDLWLADKGVARV